MIEARKDGTPVLAKLRDDLVAYTGQDRHNRLAGKWVVVRTPPGDDEWGLAGPFGYGGLPTDWFDGFVPLPDDSIYFVDRDRFTSWWSKQLREVSCPATSENAAKSGGSASPRTALRTKARCKPQTLASLKSALKEYAKS